MDTSNEWVAQLDEAVAGVEPLLRDLRRELHQHPEPSGEEWHTSLRVESLLREEIGRAHV